MSSEHIINFNVCNFVFLSAYFLHFIHNLSLKDQYFITLFILHNTVNHYWLED